MIIAGLLQSLTLMNLAVAFCGVSVGIIIGALPGLGASIAMTLALPLTFNWPAETALILLAALYCGATYGGSISAILINTPGTPASGATTFDGYPIAQRGEGDIALGLSTMSSFIGGIVGAVILITVAPLVTRIVLSLGPSQTFLIGILSLCIIGALGEGKMLKGLISCGIGLLLSFVGIDVLRGYGRFTFHSWYLSDGINPTTVMIGLFAISEMLLLVESGSGSVSERLSPGNLKNVLKGCLMVFRYPVNLIKSSLIGSFVGAMPAMGVTTASFLAYMVQANSRTKKGEVPYGKGNYQGVIAPETSNNAVTATAMIPTLTIGIPGSGAMAIVLGAMAMQGIVPGPDLFKINTSLVYTVMTSFFIINILMLALGIIASGYVSKVTGVSSKLLVPCVIVLCMVGAYALKSQWQDIILATVMGLIGYAMKKTGYPSLGLLLGLLLGPLIETSFHQAVRIGGGSYSVFYKGSINQVLVVIIALSVLWPIIKGLLNKGKLRKSEE